MAAKYFLMYNTTLERWNARSFKPNGDVDVVFTITQGEARDRWQELNGVDLLTLRFVTSNAEIPPFKDIPITEIASDLTGTLYASKSDFEIATKSFFDSNVEKTTLTDGSQKTQVVDPNGVNVDFATATKQTDGSQKTQLVDASGNQITLSSGEPRILSCEYTRPINTTTRPAYGAINETVSVIKELLAADSKQAANLNGGGGVVINGSIVSNNTSDVGRQFGIVFLREDISPIIADNAVQTMLYANQGKRIMVVYATMESQSTGSDVVIGRFNLPFEYQCKADSKALKALLFDVTGGTTVSGSKYMVTVNVQVQK